MNFCYKWLNHVLQLNDTFRRNESAPLEISRIVHLVSYNKFKCYPEVATSYRVGYIDVHEKLGNAVRAVISVEIKCDTKRSKPQLDSEAYVLAMSHRIVYDALADIFRKIEKWSSIIYWSSRSEKKNFSSQKTIQSCLAKSVIHVIIAKSLLTGTWKTHIDAVLTSKGKSSLTLSAHNALRFGGLQICTAVLLAFPKNKTGAGSDLEGQRNKIFGPFERWKYRAGCDSVFLKNFR